MKQFFIRIVLFLVFLELFFWIGSWVAQGTQLWGNAILAQKKDVYRIMCIGDSITYGGGKDSYPVQLEEILNTKSQGTKYQVLNQGTAGEGSSATLKELPEWLAAYRPDMVVAMLGIMDGAADAKDDRKNRLDSFLNGIKTYRLFLQLKEQWLSAFKEQVTYWRGKAASAKNDPVAAVHADFDLGVELSKQPEDLRKLYLLIRLAEGSGRFDIAEALYEQFLQKCTNVSINGWVVKEYGVLLIKAKKYGKFVRNMEKIPFDAWTFDWVRGYCHGDENMAEVRGIIEKMVSSGVNPLVYGYVASCYQEGGRKDLADSYLKKVEAKSGDAFSPLAQNNIRAVKRLLLEKGIQPVFIQYPMRDIGRLRAIFNDDLDRDKIIFVDNGPAFRKAVSEQTYEAVFSDRAEGDFGHGTWAGNRILAENVARAILKRLQGQELLAPAR